MNLNYETYVKQEFLNEEDELNTFPIADFNIPIKNEPISDEITPLVTIKNEPINETPLTAVVSKIKDEDPLQNQISVPGNSFIVYELETPSITQHVCQVKSTPKISQFIDEASCLKTELSSLHTQTPSNPNTSLVTQTFQNPALNITTAKPTTKATPPVLLNAQLRKRNKVVVHTNTADKRARYNIEGVKVTVKDPITINTIEPVVTPQATSVGGKKIINHLIKNKRTQRKLGDHTVNVKKRLENEKSKNVALQNKIPLMEPSESITENLVNFNTHINSNSLFIKTFPQQALANNENTSKDTLNTPELRVKCLCSLTADTSNNLSHNLELRDFFKEMFEKTRRLNKNQQRKIRMTLLQAILDAEESVEKGKCCGF